MNKNKYLLIIATISLVGIAAYESLKQFLFPDISIWQSHVVTIGFVTSISLVAGGLVLSRLDALILQLSESKRYKDTLVDTAIDAIITIDKDGRVVEFNPSAEKMFGYRSKAVFGKDVSELIIPPNYRDKHRRGIKRYLYSGEKHILGKMVEISAIRSDGEEFPIEITVAHIQVSESISFTAFIRDITKRKHAQDQLNQTNDTLERCVEKRTKHLVREISERMRMENDLRMQSKKLENAARVQEALKTAAKMQEALLPSPAKIRDIDERYGIRLESYYVNCQELGGDLWGVRSLGRGRLGVYIADFTGHGVDAALNTFRLHSLMSAADLPVGNPAKCLSILNTMLSDLLPRGQFATMFYGIINTRTNRLTYSAAASTYAVVGRMEENSFSFQETSGMPLGIKSCAKYTNRHLDFPPGSFVFLYSDALTETIGNNGVMLGEEGLSGLIQEGLSGNCSASPLSTIVGLFDATAPNPLPDDLTAVWLERRLVMEDNPGPR